LPEITLEEEIRRFIARGWRATEEKAIRDFWEAAYFYKDVTDRDICDEIPKLIKGQSLILRDHIKAKDYVKAKTAMDRLIRFIKWRDYCEV